VSLGVSIILHVAVLSLFLAGSMGSPGTRDVPEIIIVSLGAGSLEAVPEPVLENSPEPVMVQEPEAAVAAQTVEVSPPHPPPEILVVNEQPAAPIKETLPVPEGEEEVLIETPPVINATQETVSMDEEAAEMIPAEPAPSEQSVQFIPGASAGEPDQAGPPAETMLAYAGADLLPGILAAGGREGDSALFVPAVTMNLPIPSYPGACRRRGQEGTVVLSVEVGIDGKPGRIRVVDTSGFPRLDRAAEDALKRAVFRPARQDAVSVESTKQVAFTFRLEDEEN